MRVLVVTNIFPSAAGSPPLRALQPGSSSRRSAGAATSRCWRRSPRPPGAALARRWSAAGVLADAPRHEWIDGLERDLPEDPLHSGGRARAFGGALRGVGVAPAAAPPGGFRRAARGLGLPGRSGGRRARAGAGRAHGGEAARIGHGTGWPSGHAAPQLALALPRATRVVAVSRTLAASAIALGVSPDRVDLVANGIDGTLFHPAIPAGALAALGHAGDTGKWILYVGRIVADKGMHLAAAFQRVAASHPDARRPRPGAMDVLGEHRGGAAAARRAGAVRRPPPARGGPDLAGGVRPAHPPEPPRGDAEPPLERSPAGWRRRPRGAGDSGRGVRAGAASWCCSIIPRRWAVALSCALDEPYDPAVVASLGARGGWDESAGRLHDVLARACAAAGPSGA